MVALRDISPFVAHSVPTRKEDELNWSARQFREISTQLQALQARMDFVTTNYSFGGHGSLRLTGPVALADLTPTWVPFKPWQAKGSELYVVSSVANGTHDILVAGTWAVNFTMDITHNELNQARNMRLRLMNMQTALPITANDVRIAVPRDTPETRFTGLSLFDFATDNATFPIGMQISADVGDTFTGVNVTQGNWSVFNVGPWLGALPQGGGTFRR